MDDITTIQPFKLTPLAIRSETSGELYKLSGEMVVGREVECDIQLASLQISRYHAKIVVSANGVFVEDLHSSNGTFVNDRKVGRRTPLAVGDRLAFDDLVFRVTTLRSGDADETKIMSPGSLSSKNIEDINNIASDKLRPAAEDPAELERARAALKARQASKPKGDAPELPIEKDSTPAGRGAKGVGIEGAGSKGAGAKDVRSKDVRSKDGYKIKPIEADKAHKVHEIPDMEAFLKFAGSGLKPQEPLSKKEASPFGLANSHPVSSEQSAKGQPPKDSSSANEPAKQASKPLPLESESSAGGHPLYNVGEDVTRPITPEESAELLRQAQALKTKNTTEDRVAVSKPSREQLPGVAPQYPQARMDVPPVPQTSFEEDDKTSYVSLNTMDRYVETNARADELKDSGSGPRIVAMTAPIRGKVFQLVSDEDVQCWTIGRDDNADVCIRDKAVSREHAWITKLDAFYQLTVNDDASEIFLNGVTAVEANLRHGDRLQFGAMELVFRLDVKTAAMQAIGKENSGIVSALKRLFSRRK